MKFFYSSVLLVGVAGCLQAVDQSKLSSDGALPTKSSSYEHLNNFELGVPAVSSHATLPILFRGDLSPANAAYSITRSGVYQLTSAKTASGVPNISITANNVTLDLGGNMLTGGTNGIEVIGNNVTVKNGTITGMSQSGVFVQGNGCRVENCDVLASPTGITLQNTSECVIENCRVLNMAQAGVSLVASFTNYVHGCSVIGVQTSGDAYGFITTDGGSNVFDTCLARDVKTTHTSLVIVDVPGLITAESGGFIFKGTEQNSQLFDCNSSAITALEGYKNKAYGIGLLPGAVITGANALLPVTQIPEAIQLVFSVAWLVSGDAKYLALGFTQNEVMIYKFDEATSSLSYVTKVAATSQVVSVAWLISGTTKYIGTAEFSPGKARIYKFDEATSTLSFVAEGALDGSARSVAWLVSGDAKYLAAGGDGTNEVKIFAFNEATSSLTTVTQSPYAEGQVYSVAWLVSGDKKYLASGGYPIGDTGNQVKIYEFNEATSSLLSITESPSAEAYVKSVAWLVSGDKKYLASGGDPSGDTGNQVKIYEFDEATSSLVSVTESSYAEGGVGSVAWLVWGDKKYLASGGMPNSDVANQIKIYEFDEATSSLLSVTENAYPKGNVRSVAWLVSGDTRYLASGGYPSASTGNDVKIYKLDGLTQQMPLNCVLTNNSVSGVSSPVRSLNYVDDILDGVGLSISTTLNYVANNLCYDCDSAFAGVPTQFIDSQANARGVDNIDTNLTTPDEIEVASDTLTVIENKLDAISSNNTSIQTIVDNRYACSYTPITAATTIATPGAYCLANTISNGDLSVTATGVTLCLNGRTIYNGTLSISGDRVHAYDGLIRGKTAGSGVVVTGDKCTLNDLRVSNCLTGFELNGADQNSLENCQALNCTREGYLLTNAQFNTISGCQATSIIGTGTIAGIKTSGGIGNEIVDCTVNRVSSTATGDAYGIWGVTESHSQIHDNTINDVSAVAGKAKGLALDEDTWLKNAISFQASFSTLSQSDIRTVDWLQVQPGLSYLLCSDVGASKLRIFRFSGEDSFNLAYEQTFAAAIYNAQWFTVYGNTYVIIVSEVVAGVDVKAYLFDLTTESLLPLSNAVYQYSSGATPYGLDCLVYEGLVYVAVSGEVDASGPEVQILSFNGDRFTLVARQEEGVTVPCVEWYTTGTRVFLGIGRQVTSPYVKVYEFFPQSSSTLVARGTYSGGDTESVRWLQYDNATYMAITSTVGSPSISVLSYNVDTGALALAASIAGNTVSGIPDWLVSGSTIYLADPEKQSAEVFSSSNRVRILQFDPRANTLTSFSDISLTYTQQALSTAWYTGVQGRAYLATGLHNDAVNRVTLNLYGFDSIGSTTSIVQNNTVSNVSGAGIAVNELSNPVLSNSVYSTTTPYEPWKPYRFDASNTIIS